MSDDPTRKLGKWAVGLLLLGLGATALIIVMAASSAGYFHGG